MRRRQRRLRSWWRHEQQSTTAALATTLHHSAQRPVPEKQEWKDAEYVASPGQWTGSSGTSWRRPLTPHLVCRSSMLLCRRWCTSCCCRAGGLQERIPQRTVIRSSQVVSFSFFQQHFVEQNVDIPVRGPNVEVFIVFSQDRVHQHFVVRLLLV